MEENFFNLGSVWFEYLPPEQPMRKGIVGAIQINGHGEAYTVDEVKALKDWLEFVLKQEGNPRCGG